MPDTHHQLQQTDDEVFRHFFARGGSLRLLADIQGEDLESLYGYARQLFDGGDIAAARNVYQLLSTLDHWNFDYLLALGLCHQRLGEHNEAVVCFGRAGMIKVDDPRAAFFAGISYRLDGNAEYAGKAFNAAINWCGDQIDYQQIKASAVSMLAQQQEDVAC
ncbi:SycD/LcrH family type III secretion system chaperone [Chromobacterium vaccinii]|uniref:SycD/LcrH family type III secretion system chaperone n=1 Tax=Chromobacterium vaccinii TaxID=1108595 RepID=UPI003C78FD7A